MAGVNTLDFSKNYFVSNVGFDTTSPLSPIHISSNLTNTSTRSIRIGSTHVASVNGTYNIYGEFASIKNTVNNGIVNSGELYGIYVEGFLNGPGNISYVRGGAFTTGTTTGGSGTVTGATALTAIVYNDGNGTINTAYGVYTAVSKASGTITNAYGIYIDGVQGSSTYAIYQADATTKSYFAGSIGIKNTAPAEVLSINGRMEMAVQTTLPTPTSGYGKLFFINV